MIRLTGVTAANRNRLKPPRSQTAQQWQRIGARFALACTLHLIRERRDEAAAEFAALGVPAPGAAPVER